MRFSSAPAHFVHRSLRASAPFALAILLGAACDSGDGGDTSTGADSGFSSDSAGAGGETGEAGGEAGGEAEAGDGDGDGDGVPQVPTNAPCPPEGPTWSYDVEVSAFMVDYCLSCHSNTLSGPLRFDAPEGVDYDTRELIGQHLEGIDGTAGAYMDVVNEEMPVGPADTAPSAVPTLEERTELAEWVACEMIGMGR